MADLFERLHGGFIEMRDDMNWDAKHRDTVMTVKVEGIEELQKRLDALRSSNPNMKKGLNKIMRTVISEVRKNMLKEAKGTVGSGMPNSQGDPRQAYKAIRMMVYKRVFGGNVNIISRRKRSGYVASIPAQKQQTGRGGNRRSRSARTLQIMSYWGEDRGFILRFLNDGTKTRQIRTGNNRSVNKWVGRGHKSESLRANRNGNRGKINGNHWFGDKSRYEMNRAADKLTALIDRAITEVWGANAIDNVNVFEE